MWRRYRAQVAEVERDQELSEEEDFVARLNSFGYDQEPLETTLRTDARVIARVTDGIYRQPGSALRELISNAYDADATRVTIRTDRPRFRKITIEDDGRGMNSESLVHLLYHIGGSAKRTVSGIDMGITNPSDPTLSPGGRRLIGKIGIGLFSVAQLTQAFQIITKVAGDNHRTVASVMLKQYSDQLLADQSSEQEYEAGKVLVWRESAEDLWSHGTTIVLDAIRPQTRDTLRSKAIWDAVHSSDADGPHGRLQPPRYHVGSVQPTDEDRLRGDNHGYHKLPWSDGDGPAQAFHKLVDSVWDSFRSGGVPNPRIEQLFDYYLTMVWHLSLSVPLPYIDIHPLDITGTDGISAFRLSTGQREHQLHLGSADRVREVSGLGNAVNDVTDFSVTIDDLQLKRPICIRDIPETSTALKTPLLFVSQEREQFSEVHLDLSGGPLGFQAYLLWAPKIAPAEHQGVLIRVHEASGTLFDPTFLRFPVTEQRRLSQISCEIFITEGFDGALNIDRESFNYAHPHVVALTKWLHAALRRVIAVQKRLAAAALQTRRAGGAERARSEADKVVSRVWDSRANNDGTEAPDVVFVDEPKEAPPDSYVFERHSVIGEMSGPNWQQRRDSLEDQLAKITQLLASYDLLDSLSHHEQQELITAIREIIQVYKV